MTTGHSQPALVFGQSGRMARAVARAIDEADDLTLAGTCPARAATVEEVAEALARTSPDCIVCDFTDRTSLEVLLAALGRVPRSLLTGTSGLTPADEAALDRHAQRHPVMHGQNFSPGAIMVRRLIAMLAQLSRLDPAWRGAVLDLHHARKLDPVSATASDWSRAWTEEADGSHAPSVASIRLGDAISEHTFIAAGRGERVEIAHRLMAFDAPVAGALVALRHIAGAPPGRYDPSRLLDPGR